MSILISKRFGGQNKFPIVFVWLAIHTYTSLIIAFRIPAAAPLAPRGSVFKEGGGGENVGKYPKPIPSLSFENGIA